MNSLTEVKIWPVAAKEGSNFVANGSFTISDAVIVKFRLLKKNDGSGFFLSLPSQKNLKFDEAQGVSDTNKKYYDEVILKSATVREELTAAVEKAYEEKLAEGGGGRAETPKTASKKTPVKSTGKTGAIVSGGPPF